MNDGTLWVFDSDRDFGCDERLLSRKKAGVEAVRDKMCSKRAVFVGSPDAGNLCWRNKLDCYIEFSAERTDVQRPGGRTTTSRITRTATPARSAATAGYLASRAGANMFSPRSKTAGSGPSGFGSARHVPLVLPRCTRRRCNLNRGTPPRLQRCRSFASASSHRTRAWRQRYRDR
jgi:hypothetical protein